MPKRKATTELIKGVDPDTPVAHESSSDMSDNAPPKERKIFKAVRRLAPKPSSTSEDNFKSFSGFDWGNKPTESPPKPETPKSSTSDILPRVRKLNCDFIESIKLYYSENDSADFRPTLKDYIRHFDNLEKESSKEGTAQESKPTALSDFFNSVNVKPHLGFSVDFVKESAPVMTPELFSSKFTGDVAAKTDPVLPKFDFPKDIFSAPKLTSEHSANLPENSSANIDSSVPKIDFIPTFNPDSSSSVPQITPELFRTNFLGDSSKKVDSLFDFSAKPSSDSVFALPNIPKYENPFGAIEDVESEIPDVVEEDAEAAESLFSGKCVLYLFNKSDSKWDRAGVGKAYVRKNEDTSHVCVRADVSTGVILLNIILTRNSMMELKTGKRVTFVSSLEDGPRSTLLSFTEEGEGKKFFDVVTSCFGEDL